MNIRPWHKLLLCEHNEYDEHELLGILIVPKDFDYDAAKKDFMDRYEIGETHVAFQKALGDEKHAEIYRNKLELPTGSVEHFKHVSLGVKRKLFPVVRKIGEIRQRFYDDGLIEDVDEEMWKLYTRYSFPVRSAFWEWLKKLPTVKEAKYESVSFH